MWVLVFKNESECNTAFQNDKKNARKECRYYLLHFLERAHGHEGEQREQQHENEPGRKRGVAHNPENSANERRGFHHCGQRVVDQRTSASIYKN